MAQKQPLNDGYPWNLVPWRDAVSFVWRRMPRGGSSRIKDPEDICQQAGLEFVANPPTGDPHEIRGKFYARLNARVQDLYREKPRLRSLPESFDPPDQGLSASDALEAMETNDARRRSLHAMLAGLPPRQKEILTMRYLQGLAVKEIASRFGITVTAVYITSEAAMSKLLAPDAEMQSEGTVRTTGGKQ